MKPDRWVPLNNLPQALYLEALYDDYEGFRLVLKGEDSSSRPLRITFEDVLSYRNTDEGALLETLSNFNFGGWSLFTSQTSNYIDWFVSESGGIYDENDIVHYFVYTPNDCVDILSIAPPRVELL
mmetsp:Transcript_7221/g.9363  ORF Transcript_7221/g.9363 Transcript_7221/m.9363 type:complete len:125 (+) Transcript_7221:142-516(+)